MKTNYLFSHRFKKTGWALFGLGVLLGFFALFVNETPSFFDLKVFAISSDGLFESEDTFRIIKNNIFNEIVAVLIVIGGILAAFSKEKNEDEFIAKIRLESLVWAVYVNYGVLLFAVLFIYEFSFFSVMIFNMFTVLIFFLIRYNWMLRKLKRMTLDEK
ncbi:MAG: hypothetical protein COA33_014245 [Fluviicola sp.]|nr:hypothetical protein [Fluviicola sp.]